MQHERYSNYNNVRIAMIDEVIGEVIGEAIDEAMDNASSNASGNANGNSTPEIDRWQRQTSPKKEK